MLSHAREIRRALGNGVTLIMNDRADICIAAGYEGVHVGQDDLSAEGARTVIGPERILGVSTHNLEQLQEADAGPADYIAYRPGLRDPLEAAIPIPSSAWTEFARRGPQPGSRWWPSAASLAPMRAR